jgi:hypothetical protein
MTQSLAGQNAIIDANRRDAWFKEDEISARFYRPILSYEAALYAYHGYWKSPMGAMLTTGEAYFPRMDSYGASVKGDLGNGLFNIETGYYDSREHTSATKIVPNDEFRFLTGYEREIGSDFTAGVQYYLEWMMDHDGYLAFQPNPATARDEFRHVFTLRLTKMLMNQNLILSFFTFYSPNDHDAYFRPIATYKLTDRWTLTANGNIFVGQDDHTFFGQMKNNSNLNLGVRYSF